MYPTCFDRIMKNKTTCLLLAVVLILTQSCKNDIETNADWKEIFVVYGLLNATDSVHYVRVNRAFLSENQSALEVAKVVDTSYYSQLEVKVEEFDGNTLKNTYLLATNNKLAKDTGVFGNYPNVLFSFGAKLNTSWQYKITVKNKTTGNLATAKTTLVTAPLQLNFPSFNTSSFLVDTAKNLNLSWSPGFNAVLYDLTMRFYWDEYDSATNQLTDSNKFVDWPMVANRELSTGSLINSRLAGNTFYEYMGVHIPPVEGKFRKAKKIDFMYWGADKEFKIYREVNAPSIGLVQKKPEYTNLSNGHFGLFASRHYMVIPNVSISQQTSNFLEIYRTTRHLKFKQ